MGDDQELNKTSIDKQLDAYQKLADSASARAASRRTMEWRMALALWSAFGAATGVVLTASHWHPTGLQIALAIAGSIAILIVFATLWLPYLALAGQRELRQSYFWESHVQKLLGVSLPPHLVPKPRKFAKADWPSAFEQDPDRMNGDPNADRRQLKTSIHEAQWFQLLITLVFALLFVMTILGRWMPTNDAPQHSPHLEIKGSRIEIQGSSTIDVK